MVILIKKKEHLKPPLKHYFETRPAEGFGAVSTVSSDYSEYSVHQPPLYPISWGWNASGRSGNATSDQLSTPQRVQRSCESRYIASAAGKHHSLLVTDQGNIHSFGEGRKGQLGYGNVFIDSKVKGGIFQKLPRQVTPSGSLKDGRDLRIVQVACGSSFSIARERSVSEGSGVAVGLLEMEGALIHLLQIYPESDRIQLVWANIRHERGQINRSSEGLLLAWGSGDLGQLGLGRYVKYVPSPQVIPKLRYVKITKIAAGEKHVLAISDEAHLYSWGCGFSGQLGHRDFENRYVPEIVSFFLPYYIEDCSGGVKHSAVLITAREGLPRIEQPRRVSCFGRGAHGRLGNGTNRSVNTPVLVEGFPGSTSRMFYRQVCCGGAHTMLLASKKVSKTLANPWGLSTAVLAWGFGFNGQLGTGYAFESYKPVKVRFPKWVIIAEISAGKSWSLARTIGGELYSWGKGWRGELGQNFVRISLAPRKIETFASYVRLSSGNSHNLCVAASKSVFNPSKSISAASNSDILGDIIDVSTLKTTNESQFSFNCCRRYLRNDHPKNALRFVCFDCLGMTSICFDCCRHCHKGHRVARLVPSAASNIVKASAWSVSSNIIDLESVNLQWKESMKAIESKLNKKGNAALIGFVKASNENNSRSKWHRNKSPKRKKAGISSFLEKYGSRLHQVRLCFPQLVQANDDYEVERSEILHKKSCCRCGLFNTSCRLLPTVPEATEDEPSAELLAKNKAAKCIQILARSYLNRIQLHRMKLYLKSLRYEVCTMYYFKKILNPIWAKFHRSFDQYRESIELKQMAIEEDLKRKFDYNYVSQLAIAGMDAMSFGVKSLFGKASILVPRIRERSGATIGDQVFPTFVFSQSSLREQQSCLPEAYRLSPKSIAHYSRFFPLYDRSEGKYFDPDVSLFTEKYLRDAKTSKFRMRHIAHVKKLEAAKEQQKALVRQEILASRLAKKNIISRAAMILSSQRPPPPAKAPPRHLVVAAASERRLEIHRRRYEAILENDKKDDAGFNMFNKNLEPPPQRRHSICDPTLMYRRIVGMRYHLQIKCYSKRRNSLPLDLRFLHSTENKVSPFIPLIKNSLDIFHQRLDIISDFVQSNNAIVPPAPRVIRRDALLNVLSQCWLNPRLPIEMNLILKDGRRRRSIAEPERISQQVFAMFETRNALEDLRIETKELRGFPPRRRSFDMGEILDSESGIFDTLGYQFEETFKVPTYGDLRRDSIIMETRVLNAGLHRPSLAASDDTRSNWRSSERSKRNEPSKIESSDNYSSDTTSQALLNSVNVNDVLSSTVWQEHYSEDGQTYYFNASTGESRWDAPTGQGIEICNQYQDSEGNWYWYNSSTGETSWMD